MSINVSVISTANSTRHFALNSVESISHLLINLKRSSRIFTGNLLIIGSGAQTEIFSTASIACVEMESENDLEVYLPRGQNLALTSLTTVEAIEPFEGGLPQGGIGLMNPLAMTRLVIIPGIPDLPKEAWVADDL